MGNAARAAAAAASADVHPEVAFQAAWGVLGEVHSRCLGAVQAGKGVRGELVRLWAGLVRLWAGVPAAAVEAAGMAAMEEASRPAPT